MHRLLSTFRYAAKPLMFAISLAPSFCQETISGTRLVADVTIFRSALEQLHPQLHRYTRKEELNSSFKSLTADARNGMNEAEFLTRISEIAVKVHCGHTFVNLMNQKDADLERLFNKQTFIPLYFKLIGTRMLVTENVSDDALLNSGTEILEINGLPVKRILQTCLKFSNADGLHNNAHRLRSLEVQREPGEARNYTNLFDIYYPQLFPLRSASYKFKARDLTTRKLSVVTTSALMKAERIAKAEAKFSPLPSPESAWQFRHLSDQTAYMKLASFFTYQWKLDTVAFYKNAFADMQRTGVKSLVVDLRGNVGGLVQNATELERYLSAPTSTRSLKQRTIIKCLKANKNVSPYLTTYEGDLGKLLTTGLSPKSMKKLPGNYYEIVDNAPAEAQAPPVNRFTGKVYFLADATDASATSELLARVRLNKLGTIVGEQTAGNRQGINTGVFFLRLPSSKVEIDIPALSLLPVTPEPDGGVPPDVHVEQRAEDLAQVSTLSSKPR